MDRFERKAIWLSFLALMAFLAFFLLERVINILGESRRPERRSRIENEVQCNRDAPIKWPRTVPAVIK